MMNNNLSVIRQEGYKALNNRLGAVRTVIFMKLFDNGYGDYTTERDIRLGDISIDEIAASIRERVGS